LIKHRDENAKAGSDPVDSPTFKVDLKPEGLKEATRGIKTKKRIVPAELSGVLKEPFPSHVPPMLATLAASPFSDPGWIFEPKLDGFRSLAFVQNGNVKLVSRNQVDRTNDYPEIVDKLTKLEVNEAVLDGEIVALDKTGKPCFQCLQQHLKLAWGHKSGEKPAQLIYYVFDLVYVDGYALWNVPLVERKALLREIVHSDSPVIPVPYFDEDGEIVYKAAINQGLEGVVAKKKSSVYEQGRRSRDWLKVKAVLSDDFVVGGYSEGYGNREHSFGALLLGYFNEHHQLIYAGRVGSGFDQQMLSALKVKLESIKTDRSPFLQVPPANDTVVWVKPELVAEIKYSQWTQEGLLRIPVFLRLREDKSPSEVLQPTSIQLPGKDNSTTDNAREQMIVEIENQIFSAKENTTIVLNGNRIPLTNLDKPLFPDPKTGKALTKRDYIVYLAKMSEFLLPHLKDRPLTMTRYPGGIYGEHFFQKHWNGPRPDYVNAVNLFEQDEGNKEYLTCDNLETLLWLGQLASLEVHTWFSRIKTQETGLSIKNVEDITDYPDFLIFDLDPYIYSGKERKAKSLSLMHPPFQACPR